MGSLLRGLCEKCGFEKEFSFGAGMGDFQTVCKVPAINTKTGKFIIKNYFEKGKLDTSIIFYNDKRLFKGNIEKMAFQWGDIYLNSKNNYCPSCKDYSLSFELWGLFD